MEPAKLLQVCPPLRLGSARDTFGGIGMQPLSVNGHGSIGVLCDVLAGDRFANGAPLATASILRNWSF
jgi:hypothetical protein